MVRPGWEVAELDPEPMSSMAQLLGFVLSFNSGSLRCELSIEGSSVSQFSPQNPLLLALRSRDTQVAQDMDQQPGQRVPGVL